MKLKMTITVAPRFPDNPGRRTSYSDDVAQKLGTMSVLTSRPVHAQDQHLLHLQHFFGGLRATHLGYRCVQCGSNEHGALHVTGRAGPIWASRSYAHDMMLIAGSDIGAVGVDIQDMNDPFLDTVMSVAAHSCEHVPNRTSAAALWARKQALLKATGYGMSVDPSQISLTTPCTGSVTITNWDSPLVAEPQRVWWHEQVIDRYWCSIAVIPEPGVNPEHLTRAIVDDRATV